MRVRREVEQPDVVVEERVGTYDLSGSQLRSTEDVGGGAEVSPPHEAQRLRNTLPATPESRETTCVAQAWGLHAP